METDLTFVDYFSFYFMPSKVPSSSSDERKALLEEGAQSETVDTSLPEIPESAKELLFFSNYGYGLEVFACVVVIFLGFKYLFGGCLIDGVGMFCLGGTIAWLCGPQLVRPFISNPIIRWFMVSNHSHHITGLASILAVFVTISYFSWTNDCHKSSVSIQSSTITVLTLLSLAIICFLVACYRDEKGNAGYIYWILKLIIRV
jgi:hypothetical protein